MYLLTAIGCMLPVFPGMHVTMTSDDKMEVMCNATRERWVLYCLESVWTGAVGECSRHSGGGGGGIATGLLLSTLGKY